MTKNNSLDEGEISQSKIVNTHSNDMQSTIFENILCSSVQNDSEAFHESHQSNNLVNHTSKIIQNENNMSELFKF